jgi:hypothetical protein
MAMRLPAATPAKARFCARLAKGELMPPSRLAALADGRVTFRRRDYAHGCQSRTMTLEADEFLHRFLRHILPASFVRICYFGFSNRHRTQLLHLCRSYLPTTTGWDPAQIAREPGSCS